MKLKCKKCGNKWDYSGKHEYFATCPECRRLVKIKEIEK